MARPHVPVIKANSEETKIRLPPPVDAVITAEAERLGIPKAVFLRSIIMERLADKLPAHLAA